MPKAPESLKSFFQNHCFAPLATERIRASDIGGLAHSSGPSGPSIAVPGPRSDLTHHLQVEGPQMRRGKKDAWPVFMA